MGADRGDRRAAARQKWRANRTRWRDTAPHDPTDPTGGPTSTTTIPADIVADRLEAVDFLAELETGRPRALSMLLRHAAGETLAEIGATEGVTEGRVSRSSPSTIGRLPLTGALGPQAISPPRSRLAGVAPALGSVGEHLGSDGAPGRSVGRRMLNVYAGVQVPVGTPRLPG